MTAKKFYGKVRDGRLQPYDRKSMTAFVHELDGKGVCIEISEHGTYSGSQWGYFHALLAIVTKSFNELGNNFTIEQVKDMLRLKCPELVVSNYVQGVHVGDSLRSTKTLNKEEMGNVIERLKAWASEFDIHLPEPREQIKIDNV